MRIPGRLGVLALALATASCFASSCRGGSSAPMPAEGRGNVEPPAPEGRQAEDLARCVLDAYGGREAWDAARYVSWINLGQRLIVWDKQTDDIRVENRMTVVLMNLDTRRGRAWKYGEEITDPDSLERALEFGYESFRLDSHEFLLPFLLEGDDFVLRDLGRGEVDGQSVDQLDVTFVGDEPYAHSEYHLLIDPASCRIRRFVYYMDAGDEHPRFAMPWGDHEWYGGILLALERGEQGNTHVQVTDEMPASVFASPQPVPWLAEEVEKGADSGEESEPS